MEKTQRRQRKKTCEIDSIEKLRSSKPKKEDESTEAPKKESSKKGLIQTQLGFSKFNITIKKAPQASSDDLKKYYDDKFNITDHEKTAKLLVQESSDIPIPEPMTENEYRSGTVSKRATKTRNRNQEIHKVLKHFIEGTEEKWPESTDLLCWHCCHSFEGPPIPCPIEYDDIRERYNVNGIFCSWGCVAAYSIEKYSNLTTVYQFRNEVLGEESEVPVAPARICLKQFGGFMDIDKFREHSESKSSILISTEDLSYVNQEIAEIKTGL